MRFKTSDKFKIQGLFNEMNLIGLAWIVIGSRNVTMPIKLSNCLLRQGPGIVLFCPYLTFNRPFCSLIFGLPLL